MRARHQFQEDAVFLEDEILAARVFVVCLADRVGGKPRAIGFVGRQALDAVSGVSCGGRALMRREITDQVGAAARDDLAPGTRILLEGRFAERVDLVADEAGDGHFDLLVGWLSGDDGSTTVETSLPSAC